MRRLPPLHLLLAGSLFAGSLAAAAPPDASAPLRIGFTYAMFAGLNENDARASIRALAATIAHDGGIPADPSPQLFTGPATLDRALADGAVDAIGLSALEFAALLPSGHFDRYLFAIHDGDPSEEYLLLVPLQSPIHSLGQLRGGSFVRVDTPRMSLAPAWLETLLARASLPELDHFFARIDQTTKANKAVLDVYFGKADACVTTRRSLALMTELNPQLGARLRIVATSPRLVPALFAIRAGFNPVGKDRMLRLFTDLDHTPAGRQALTIFQVGHVAELPLATFDPTLAFLAELARLRPALAPRLAPPAADPP